jgi:hypothetical protein
VLAVAGLVFAALVLRPDAGLFAAGNAPLSHLFGWVLLLAFGWLFAAELTRRHYRATAGYRRGLTPHAERLRDATLRLLPAAVVAVPAALFLIALPKHNHPDLDASQSASPLPTLGERPRPVPNPRWLGDIAAGLEVLLIALVALIAVVQIWRRLRNRPRRSPASAPVPTVALDEREQLAGAIGSGRRALLGDDARAAVIACYAAMEQSLAASGVARRIADSPSDLLARAIAAGTVPAADGSTLTVLFRAARYSGHPMGAPELRQARAALDAIAQHLGQLTPDHVEAGH